MSTKKKLFKIYNGHCLENRLQIFDTFGKSTKPFKRLVTLNRLCTGFMLRNILVGGVKRDFVEFRRKTYKLKIIPRISFFETKD